MSGLVRASNVDRAGLWMRVDTREGARSKARATGRRSIVIDVPKSAASIYFGVLSEAGATRGSTV
jgi:hypothetical protein